MLIPTRGFMFHVKNCRTVWCVSVCIATRIKSSHAFKINIYYYAIKFLSATHVKKNILQFVLFVKWRHSECFYYWLYYFRSQVRCPKPIIFWLKQNLTRMIVINITNTWMMKSVMEVIWNWEYNNQLQKLCCESLLQNALMFHLQLIIEPYALKMVRYAIWNQILQVPALEAVMLQ